jgi:hypothetical protein
MVQVAATGGHLDAMLLLADAGAAWRLPRGNSSWPDAAQLYTKKVPGCKVRGGCAAQAASVSGVCSCLLHCGCDVLPGFSNL